MDLSALLDVAIDELDGGCGGGDEGRDVLLLIVIFSTDVEEDSVGPEKNIGEFKNTGLAYYYDPPGPSK